MNEFDNHFWIENYIKNLLTSIDVKEGKVFYQTIKPQEYCGVVSDFRTY